MKSIATRKPNELKYQQGTVIVKNVREKGGTGKLKTSWEEKMFEVLEKKENLPVYKVKNLKKGSDIRVVHRNLLMKCEELPQNIFDEKHKQTPKPKVVKRKAVGSSNLSKDESEVTFKPEEELREDSDNEIIVAVYPDIAVSDEMEGTGVETPDVLIESEPVESPPEEEGEPLDSEEPNDSEELGEVQMPNSDPDDSDVESASSEDGGKRISTRIRKPRQVYSYNEIGGNPVLVPWSSDG